MKKKYKITLLLLAVFFLVVLSFLTGCLVGFGTSGSGQNLDLDLINQAWKYIKEYYVDTAKIDSVAQSQGAIRGMVNSLEDPYSAYLDPDTYKLFESNLAGDFEGIGATVNVNEDNLPVIVAPLDNSPAANAGLKTGDIILAIDGENTTGMSLTEAVLKIRGTAGTTVTLTVLHEGEPAAVDISIVRGVINVASVEWEMKNDIAYIKILEFGEDTNEELNKVLEAIDMTTTKGIMLDLRSNPGGLVPTVVDVASHFIDNGVVITMVDNKGNRTSNSVNPNGVFTDLPMVVLVDQYSASGSEVLSGALQDYHRATIAGVTTFGKGSYNTNIPLQDGSDIYLTIGRWETPNGNLIEGKGIEPDYILTQTGDDQIQWAIDFLHENTE